MNQPLSSQRPAQVTCLLSPRSPPVKGGGEYLLQRVSWASPRKMPAQCFLPHDQHWVRFNQWSCCPVSLGCRDIWLSKPKSQVTIAAYFYLLGERHILNCITTCLIPNLFPCLGTTGSPKDRSLADQKCPGTGASAAWLLSFLLGKSQARQPCSKSPSVLGRHKSLRAMNPELEALNR